MWPIRASAKFTTSTGRVSINAVRRAPSRQAIQLTPITPTAVANATTNIAMTSLTRIFDSRLHDFMLALPDCPSVDQTRTPSGFLPGTPLTPQAGGGEEQHAV